MKSIHVTLAVVIVTASVAGVVGYELINTVSSQTTQEQIEQYEQHCEERNGELVNENVIGTHGGLHCQLEDGTLLHYHDMNINESDSA